MDLDEIERDVVYLWDKITSLSRFEKIERGKGKEIIAHHLKTLEKIDIVFDNTNWLILLHLVESIKTNDECNGW